MNGIANNPRLACQKITCFEASDFGRPSYTSPNNIRARIRKPTTQWFRSDISP
jgi:hypothetical protein